MKPVFKVQNISKDFGTQSVLKDISIEVFPGERVGIIGANGTGKSTLIQILLDNLKADSGHIIWNHPPMDVGYLNQDGSFQIKRITDSGIELLSESAEVNGDLLKYEKELAINGISTYLSGGESMKHALTQIWSFSPELLILDEPTNHMDISGIQWLMESLYSYFGTVVMVSHDRYFLDEIATRIIEISKGSVNSYEGNYSQYVTLRHELLKAQESAYQNQEKRKREIEAEISQLKKWADKAHKDSTKKQRQGEGKKEYFRMKAKKRDRQIKSKIKKLEKIDLNGIDRPEKEREIVMHFSDSSKKGKNLLEGKALSKSFDNRTVIQTSDFYIKRGDRIGLYGDNGCGKTTLLKLMLKELDPTSGELLISPTLKIAHMNQFSLSLPLDITIQNYFDCYDKPSQVDLSNRLYQMGFTNLSLEKNIMSLSYGEQTKLKLLKILLSNYDLILLDEPTNHMDLMSKETFEEALGKYDGTLIVVSHDRYLINCICNTLFTFKDGKVVRFEGNLDDYRDFEKSISNKMTDIATGSVTELNESLSLPKSGDDLLLRSLRLTQIIGDMSMLSPDDPKYQALSEEYDALSSQKNL